jgi:hypothetical protein
MSNVGFIYLVSVTTMMALSFKTFLRIDGRISSGYLHDNRNNIADPSLINRYRTDTSLHMASLYGNIMQGELTKVISCNEIFFGHVIDNTEPLSTK